LGNLTDVKLELSNVVKDESKNLEMKFKTEMKGVIDHIYCKFKDFEQKLLGSAHNNHYASQNTPASFAQPPFSHLQQFQPSDNTPSVPKVPIYRLSRGISSVPQLWEEWHEGINGSMSVDEFFKKYSRKDLPDDAERKFARRRQRIISKVKNISSDTGCTIQTAIDIQD